MSAKKRKIDYDNSVETPAFHSYEGDQPTDHTIRNQDDEELSMTPEITLFTEQQKQELLINGLPENKGRNHVPVAHVEVKRLGYSFLVTELSQQDPNVAYGLCDYDTDIKFSTFSLNDLEQNLKVENSVFSTNLDFVGKYPVGVYAKVANTVGVIVTDDKDRLLKPLFENFSKSELSNKSMKVAELKL